MEIEQLAADNLKELVEMVLELWNDCEFEEEFESYRKLIGSVSEICYLGREEGNPIAFLHIGSRNDYVEGATDMPVAYVEAIYVKPAYQKQGIAKKLIEVGETWAKQHGYTQLASDTSVANIASIDFHKKIGFTEAERIVCFIKNL